MYSTAQIKDICKLVRYGILRSSTLAKSGHPTSSLSAVEVMVTLFTSGHFVYDVNNPKNINNDKLIFSKGHASPLFYSLWAVANGILLKELDTFRQFNSRLEGHPSMKFPFTIAPTGSLGQGLSIAIGLGINSKLDNIDDHIFVLLGDGELEEGSNWEAIASASRFNITNLTAIVDVNRLEQTGPTPYEWDLSKYKQKFEAFGWETIVLKKGHDINSLKKTWNKRSKKSKKPVALIIKTNKGQGVSFLENKENWHGKALNEKQYHEAIKEIGDIDKSIRVKLKSPHVTRKHTIMQVKTKDSIEYIKDDMASRDAFGHALKHLMECDKNVIALDAGVKNSTRIETVEESTKERLVDFHIAEQNMVGASIGFARSYKIPFVSTFAAFFTRAHDQIRMAQYANVNINFVGTHPGVSIGEDGPSQMGLEDIAMFRSIRNSAVLYPSDAISTARLINEMYSHPGICYLRATRAKLPLLYNKKDTFYIGGSTVLESSKSDKVTVVTAGVTVHEALKAYKQLKKDKIYIRIIDLYSIKPIDKATLLKASRETKAIITVEDHYQEGGLHESVISALAQVNHPPIYQLAVKNEPLSASKDELLKHANISSEAIIRLVLDINTNRV